MISISGKVSYVTISRKYITPDFCITTDIPEIQNGLLTLYFPFSQLSSLNPDAIQISAVTSGSSVEFIHDDNLMALQKGEVLQKIVNIIYTTSLPSPGYTLIHAASVGLNGKAFLLTGQTQSGKSTLTAYLCSRGFSYITDDITVIEKATQRILPYRKNIMLREGSINVLAGKGISVNPDSVVSWNNDSRYPYLPDCTKCNDEYEIDKIFFIQRNETDINSVLQMDSSEAFISLMHSALYYEKTSHKSLLQIKQLIESGCYSINYSSMDYVEEILRKDALNG